MEFINVINNRYSCRSYENKPLSRELIEQVLNTARVAPSAVNIQPWKFIIVTDNETKKKLGEAYSKDWFVSAPVIIAACGTTKAGYKRKWDGQDYTWVDVSIAMDHLTLGATDAGLGTCWIAAFKKEPAKEILKVPDDVDIIAMTPLGWPADKSRKKQRKELPEITCWEQWT